MKLARPSRFFVALFTRFCLLFTQLAVASHIMRLERMRALDGSAIEVGPGSGHRVRFGLEARFDKAMLTRLL